MSCAVCHIAVLFIFCLHCCRGHGTYLDDGEIKSSLAGMREQVNKLIYIRSLKGRYHGEMGDVVIGRITEIQQKRWKVDVNSKVHAVLLLSSVNLPGGELVRRLN